MNSFSSCIYPTLGSVKVSPVITDSDSVNSESAGLDERDIYLVDINTGSRNFAGRLTC